MSATIRGPRRTRLVSRSAGARAQQKTERATPNAMRGDAFHVRAGVRRSLARRAHAPNAREHALPRTDLQEGARGG